MKRQFLLFGTIVLSFSLMPMTAQEPDNTAKNKRDRAESAVTADEQGTSKEDRRMVRLFRRCIVGDKTLSTNAHNVKVIVRGGNVTLRGPVNSDAERAAIRKIALRHAGAEMVDDKLEVLSK